MILPHEGPEARELRRIPIAVKRKLAESGASLTDDEFGRLPRIARKRLLELPVDAPVDRRAFRELVAWLRSTFLGSPSAHPVSLVDAPVAWRADAPPAELEISSNDWIALSIDARYAILHCTDEERPAILDAVLRLTTPG